MEIRAKIILNTKKEKIEILKDGRLQIYVNADRKAGQANARALELLSKHYSASPDKVKLTSGHTSQTKTFLLIEK